MIEAQNKCSILIPTYNETENIPELTSSLMNSLSGLDFEVVFIDDNSPDGTAEMVRRLSEEHRNFWLLVRDAKKGLGSAYKDGFKISTGHFVVEMDADLSHNPEDIPRLLEALNPADIAIGSRYVEGGKITGWKWHRRLTSWGANLLVRLVLGLKVKDATSGFRVYRREPFEEIANRSTLNGFEFQIEVLHIAQKLGFEIEEIPITFTDRERGQSKLSLKDVVNFAWRLLKMRFRR